MAERKIALATLKVKTSWESTTAFKHIGLSQHPLKFAMHVFCFDHFVCFQVSVITVRLCSTQLPR